MEKIYFPSYFSLKFIEHFPSLVDIELQIFSFDHYVSIIDIFLSHLKNLSYIEISYYQDTLLDDPFHMIISLKNVVKYFPKIFSMNK